MNPVIFYEERFSTRASPKSAIFTETLSVELSSGKSNNKLKI